MSPRNLTLFTRPFLAGRRARGGHETVYQKEKVWEDRGRYGERREAGINEQEKGGMRVRVEGE